MAWPGEDCGPLYQETPTPAPCLQAPACSQVRSVKGTPGLACGRWERPHSRTGSGSIREPAPPLGPPLPCGLTSCVLEADGLGRFRGPRCWLVDSPGLS